VRTGVVISETPPGLPAQAWRFPARNRIIAGLAQMVVVVECHASGGSWHTVDAALRRGIEVGAVPGSVHSSASVGTNTLLHEGATPVRGAQDVLDALGVFNSTPRGSHTREAHKTVGARRETGGTGAPVQAAQLRMLPDDPLCALEAKVLAAVGWQPRCLEEIIERSGLPVTAVVMSLEQLEQRGTITGEAGWWSRKSS
jgi:DNA processing protein